jgi:hypothetical protein
MINCGGMTVPLGLWLFNNANLEIKNPDNRSSRLRKAKLRILS